MKMKKFSMLYTFYRLMPEMEAYLRDGIRGFCLEWISLNDLKAEFMEIDLADDETSKKDDGKSVDKSNGM